MYLVTLHILTKVSICVARTIMKINVPNFRNLLESIQTFKINNIKTIQHFNTFWTQNLKNGPL